MRLPTYMKGHGLHVVERRHRRIGLNRPGFPGARDVPLVLRSSKTGFMLPFSFCAEPQTRQV